MSRWEPPQRREGTEWSPGEAEAYRPPEAAEGEEEVVLSEVPAEEIGATRPRRAPRPVALVQRDGEAGRVRRAGVGRWLAVAGLGLMVALLTAGWSAVQLTKRGEAERAIGEALVPLTEIDRLLARDYDDLLAEAARGETASVIVEEYPLGVALPAAQLAGMSRAELRAWLLSESAARIYEDGVDIFAREGGSGGGRFSARGVYAMTVGQLTERNHTIAIIVAAVLLLFVAPMLALATSAGSGTLRLRNLGLGLALAGGGLTVAALAAQLGLRLSADGSGDVFSAVLLDHAAELMGLPLRNGIIVGVLGLVVVAGSLGLGRYGARAAWAEGGRAEWR